MVDLVKPKFAALVDELGDVYEKIGERTFEITKVRDAGPEKLKDACDARSQLEALVKTWRPGCRVYMFGSSVVMGFWDGLSDIDFTVVDLKALAAGEWPPDEKSAVEQVARKLFGIGFTFKNLQAIRHARVPIIKHSANKSGGGISSAATTISASGKEVLSSGAPTLGSTFAKLLQRTVRLIFAAPVPSELRVKIEAGVLGSIDDGTTAGSGIIPEHLWWDRTATMLNLTLPTTTEAVTVMVRSRKGLSAGANETMPRLLHVGPLHEDYKPDLFSLDFDLSFRVFGVRNSVLLQRYLQSHPCGRPGSLILKDWSKTCGVNNSQHGYLTSYAVNILWIYFLVQKKHVPYISPLSIPEKLVSASGTDGGGDGVDDTAIMTPDPPYQPLLPPNIAAAAEGDAARKQLNKQMGELLLQFFAFYALEFDWSKHVVTLNLPRIVTKEELGWTTSNEVTLAKAGGKNVRYELCIEDPYEDDLNLGRHLGINRAGKIITELQRGFISLLKDPVNASCVFPKGREPGSDSTIVERYTEATLPVDDVVAVMTTVGEALQFGKITVSQDDLLRTVEEKCASSWAKLKTVWSWPVTLQRLGFTVNADKLVMARRVTALSSVSKVARPMPPKPASATPLMAKTVNSTASPAVFCSFSVSRVSMPTAVSFPFFARRCFFTAKKPVAVYPLPLKSLLRRK